MKTFAWKILHGRVKARPSGQNAPVTWAIIQAMKATKKERRKVRIFTDSISARDWIVEPKKEGALAYMWEEMCEATKPGREIEVAWVKGHKGNKVLERYMVIIKSLIKTEQKPSKNTWTDKKSPKNPKQLCQKGGIPYVTKSTSNELNL